MADDNSSRPKKKITDITPPGQSKPNDSGRAIIVNNRKIAGDPMVTSVTKKSSDEANPVSRHGKMITPPSDDEKPGAPTASDLVKKLEARKANSTAKTETDESAEEQKETSLQREDSDKQPDSQADASEPAPDDTDQGDENAEDSIEDDEDAAEESSDTPEKNQSDDEKKVPPKTDKDTKEEKETTDEVDSEDGVDDDDGGDDDEKSGKSKKTDKEADEAAAAEEERRQAELEELVDSQQYFLPINAVRRRHDKYWLLSLLVVVLAIIGLDLLLDAGMINLAGIKPATNFFDNSQSVEKPVEPSSAKTKKTAQLVDCGSKVITNANFKDNLYEGCFDNHFKDCTPASITLSDKSDFGAGTILKYQIQNPAKDGCMVQWQYVQLPSNHSWDGKPVTCTYDNSKPFKQALADHSDFEGCTGPLVKAMSTTTSPNNSDTSSQNGGKTIQCSDGSTITVSPGVTAKC